jgi:cytochrome c-type biogenesis protein CcmH
MSNFKLKLIKTLFLIGMTSAISMAYAAAVDLYPFNSPHQAVIFQQVTQELRCLVCQNQNLADSNAPLAQDLRREIYRLVNQGATQQQIITYVVARYGDFVLFKPRITPLTYLIWFGPFGLLVGSLWGLMLFIRKRQRTTSLLTLSTAEQLRLQTLLEGKK